MPIAARPWLVCAGLIVARRARSRRGAACARAAGRRGARVDAVLKKAPVIDGHNDLPWEMRQRVKYDFDRLDIAKAQPQLMTDIPRLRAGARRRAVLVGVRARRTAGRCGRRRDARADRRRARDGAPLPVGVRAGAHGRRGRAGDGRWQGRVDDGCGGRALDRQLDGHPAHAAPPRGGLHDAHPQQQRAVGRLHDRRSEAGRPVGVRRGDRARDEPTRDARGPEPHVRGHDGRRDPRVAGAGDLLALQRAGGVRRAAQRAGRDPARDGRRTAAS